MEHPRPQPEASYTIIYLLIIAALAQLVGEAIRLPEADESVQGEQQSIRTFISQTGRLLRWTPAEASSFLPKLFRGETEEEPPLIVEEINDDLLISDLSSDETARAKTDDRFTMDEVEITDKVDVDTYPALAALSTSNDAFTINTQDSLQPDWREENAHKKERNHSNGLSKTPSPHSQKTKQKAQEPSSDRITSKSDSPKPKIDQRAFSSDKIESSEEITFSSETQKTKQRARRRRSKSGVLIYGIEDESNSLTAFYQRLNEIKSQGRKVRIMHYGDSLIAGDYVTRTTRRLLQKTFGDAGHGFFLAGKGSRWYGRQWVNLKSRGQWSKKRYTRSKVESDVFGLGGVSFTSSSKGASISAKPTGIQLGGSVDRLEIHYLTQPNGGSFTLTAGGQNVEISTNAENTQAKREILTLAGKHQGEIKATLNGDGEVTLYGLVFERNQRGVIYDALGLEGARAKLLLKLMGPAWTHQIRQRSPDLYILHFGTNESENSRMSMTSYKAGVLQVIRRFKKALPKASCMLLSPMDRGEKDPETGKIKSMPIVRKIVNAQREVAASSGCAFWSTYDAMGGQGSMAKWYSATPKLAGGDLTHPTGSGANRIGAMFFAALMDGYQRYRSGQ